jgi:long-chain acyl-CoA synthetase
VYLHPVSELEEHALREHLAGRLASFKVPRYITLRNEPLPRNNSEKLDKLACKRLCYPEG